MMKIYPFSRQKSLIFIISIITILLFFQYPLMSYYQHADTLDDYSKFAITTTRGIKGFMSDTNWFGTDIISVHEKPGLFLRDAITYEHSNEIVPVQGSLPFIMHAFLYTFFKDITLTLIIGSIISVAITTTLLYYMSQLIHKKYKFKFSNMKSFLFILSFFTFPYVLFDIYRALFTAPKIIRPYIGYIGRFININHIVIFLLIWFFLLIYILFNDREEKKYFIYLGLSLVILQYSYMYYFTSALAFTMFAFLLKYRISKKTILNLVWIYLTWFLLSIPYFINLIKYQAFNEELILRAQAIHSNYPSFTNTFILLLALAVAFYLIDYKLNNKESAYLPISLFLTSLVVLNLQYILGYTIQPNHWVHAFILPVLIIISFIYFLKLTRVVKLYFKKPAKIINLVVIAAILLLSAGAIMHLSTSAEHFYKYYYFDKEDTDLFEFIQTTPKDSVFFADTTHLTDIIAVNTERKTLLGYILHTRVPTTEIHQRLIFGYDKLGRSKQDLINDLTNQEEYLNYREKVTTLTLEDHYSNVNHLQLYYHGLYYDPSTKGFNFTKRMEDIVEAYDTPKEFKLDYIIYSKDFEKYRKSSNIVYRSNKYIVKELK